MSADGKQPHRRHGRMPTYTIRVLLDGEIYEIGDISVTGFLLNHGPDWMVAGQGIGFHFIVNINGDDTYISSTGTVVRMDRDNLGIQYDAPHPKWDKILANHLAQFG